MNDTDLDDLFAHARTLTSRDHGAADRVWPRLRAQTRRTSWKTWTSTLLAGAAMLGGVLYVDFQGGRDAALPTSVAYDSYNSVAGGGW